MSILTAALERIGTASVFVGCFMIFVCSIVWLNDIMARWVSWRKSLENEERRKQAELLRQALHAKLVDLARDSWMTAETWRRWLPIFAEADRHINKALRGSGSESRLHEIAISYLFRLERSRH